MGCDWSVKCLNVSLAESHTWKVLSGGALLGSCAPEAEELVVVLTSLLSPVNQSLTPRGPYSSDCLRISSWCFLWFSA